MISSPVICLTAFISVCLFLLNCGGGGTSTQRNESNAPTTSIPSQKQTLTSQQFRESNFSNLEWNVDPQTDLPRNGRGGLRVIRPEQGGVSFIEVDFNNQLLDRVEPTWRFDEQAQARIEDFAGLVQTLYHQAYRQWTRNLNYDPGNLTLQFGKLPLNDDCAGETTVACYDPNRDVVILNENTIAGNYQRYRDWLNSGNDILALEIIQQLFLVFTHEAAHQFGYINPDGETHGGCDPNAPCHAPVGSGSVASYDHLPPPQGINGSLRYNVTEEDIRHIPNATWNDDEFDRYTVSFAGTSTSIDEWGVWIDHYFDVSGQTAPRRISGGNLNILMILLEQVGYGEQHQKVFHSRVRQHGVDKIISWG